MTPEDAREYSESLAQIGHGWWRQLGWAVRQGVHAALGISREEWREQYYGHLQISTDQRPDAVAELTAEGMSNRAIADVLGVDESTVREDKKPAGNPAPESTDPPESLAVEFEPAGNPAPETAVTLETPATSSTRELLSQSDENEWYTPRRFIEAATEVLGGIDLDPASSATANDIVQAAQFYTIRDNGLEQPWKGTVWLNPPYGGENRLFVERLIREYEAGNVTAGLALVNCHPAETAWFQRLFAYTVCFVRGRIDFSGPARDKASTSTHGSAIAYLGPDWQTFAEAFRQFGSVVRRV